jgi:hypothetical protein
MSIEEKTQFTLEVEPAVVLLLARDVSSDLLALRLAHRRGIERQPQWRGRVTLSGYRYWGNYFFFPG